MTTDKKTTTITMSDRAPLRVDTELWGVIAQAHWHNGAIEVQANEVAYIKVRDHDDGRRLVYGDRDRGNGGMPAGYRGKAAGYLVEAIEGKADEQGTIRAIRRVAGVLDMPELADECIADLPAEDLI